MKIDRAILEAAIVGFEQQKRKIDETIAELRAQLGGTSKGRGQKAKGVETATSEPKPKRKMSAAGRKRIAAAQKARWAAAKAAKKAEK